MIRRCVLSVILMLWLVSCARNRSVVAAVAEPRQDCLLATTGDGGRLQRFRREFLQKGFAGLGQFFFEPFRAIAIAARPGLGPVFVTTIAPRMRVFHRQEIKIFFPIGTLFLQWRITKTSFHPMRLALGIHARHLHVVQVLRRPRLTRDQACDPRLPWPTRPRIPISPGPLPDNASQNLHAARPSVIRQRSRIA